MLAVVRYPPRERYRPWRIEAHMNSPEECRQALQKLAGRLSELSPADRDAYFGNRTISVTIPDLGVTYATDLSGADAPVREVAPGDPPADIRLTASSDEVMSLAESPMNIARSWVAGRVKIEASMKDLFRLRRLL
jgi:hypothetical protein